MGLAYPCAGWEEYQVGDLTKETLSQVWYYSPKLAKIRKLNKVTNYRKCLSCTLLSYCKRCFMQSALEDSFGVFKGRCCEEAEMRFGVLSSTLAKCS